MTQEFSKDLLSAYYDQELSLEERAEVERELHAKPLLRDELEQLSQLSNLLGDLQKDLAPEDLQFAVMQQIERDELLGKQSSPQLQTPQPQTSQARRKNHRFLTGVILLLAAGIIIAIRFLVFDPILKPNPLGLENSKESLIAKSSAKAKKKTPNPVVKGISPKAAIYATKKSLLSKKKPSSVPMPWDEIIASLDYSKNKVAVIELDAKNDKELRKKIQQVLTAGHVSQSGNSSSPLTDTTGIRSIYFEGSANQLKKTLKKLTKEAWWKEATLRVSVNPQTVLLAQVDEKKAKTKRFGIQSIESRTTKTLGRKVRQTRLKLQTKNSKSRGQRIESLTVKPSQKTTLKTTQFQLPVQIDKQSWEKSLPKEIDLKRKIQTGKKPSGTLRILIVVKKK